MLFLSADTTLANKEWWAKITARNEMMEKDHQAIKNLSGMTKHSFFVYFFSTIEMLHRKTINILSPEFDKKGIKPYKQIYDHYLTTFSLQEYIPLYDIVRLIRNTIHSNGVYISKDGTGKICSWKTSIFAFKHLQSIDLLSVENIIFLTHEIYDSIEETLNNPCLQKIKY
ncbi:MAG TPA: hypothetical protein VLB84_09625 [Bacteroidia bacterium]|nr:hypothetical protein [Bacteroidia bacterium]